jgi:hypothetical protein
MDRVNNTWNGLSNLLSDNSTDIFVFDGNSTDVATNPCFNSSSSSYNKNATFDPKVFWCVNAFILVLVVTTLLFCCFGKWKWLHYNSENGRQVSDEIYRQTVLQRQREQQEAKMESPVQRTRKLLNSFEVNHVQMVKIFCWCVPL